MTAFVRDLSRGGIGLSSSVAIRRGEEFTVSVNLGNGTLTLHCRVANCRLVEDRYIIGAQFITIQRKGDGGHSTSQQFCDASQLPVSDRDGAQHVRDVEQKIRKFLAG